jgi:SsrA-binding protein
MAARKAPKPTEKPLATNRKARHEYHILETLEAGIVLQGTEVKSLRDGKANLKESYARVQEGEVFLINCHISPYSHGNLQNHEPVRKRKLLLNRREINRLQIKLNERGFTLVALKFYLSRGKIKLQLGLAKGKRLYDKRETKKNKDLEREARAELKSGLRDAY